MTDLMSLGISGARAHRAAIGVVAENIANAGTAGYVRRRLTLADATPASAASPGMAGAHGGMGAMIGGVTRGTDPMIDTSLRIATAHSGEAAARAEGLALVEEALADGPGGIGRALDLVEGAAVALAVRPADPVLAAGYLAAVEQAATAMTGTKGRLADTRATLDVAGQDMIERIGGALGALAAAERALRQSSDGTAGQAAALDGRDAALTVLAETTGAVVRFGDDGGAVLTLAGGATLYADRSARQLTLDVSGEGWTLGVDGRSYGVGAGSGIGGALGGLADGAARATALAGDVGLLAARWAGAVNQAQAEARTPAGSPGGPLLSSDAAMLTSDPAALATLQPDGTAASLARAGASAGDDWRRLVHGLGTSVANARDDAALAAGLVDQAGARRDRSAGVDLDREAADLMRLQQGYDAATRVLQVARQTIDSILAIF